MLFVVEVNSEIVANFLVEPFHLFIRLSVVDRFKADVDVQEAAECSPDLGGEMCFPV